MRDWLLRTSLVLACLVPAALSAQDTLPPPPAGPPRPVRLYLDCPSYRCSPDFFRSEFPYADFMRSPQDADVQVLVTEQETGGGGSEFTITVLGRGPFAGRADTLKAFTQADATEDDQRQAIARQLGLGLARYVATGPLASRFALHYTAPASEGAAVTQAVRDPWNYWAFSARISTFLNGEQSYKSSNVYGSLNANRVTAGLKVQFNAYSSKDKSEFEIDDTTSFVSEQRSYGTTLLVAPTLGGHWGWALYGEASRSTYQNQRLHLEFQTGLEYDIWPYEQVSHRMLTLRLTAGLKHFRYDEVTLYGETSETRPVAELQTSLSATQKWGSVGVTLDGSTYLHDLEKHKLELSGDLNIRLVRGLSLSLFGQVASIHDQLFLPAGGATDEEILLRRRQLATDYSYYTSIGLNYSFGSRFNNVVNPRFR